MTIKGLLNRVENLDTNKIAEAAIEATATDLAEVNRERMLDGVRADGSIMPTYSYISQTVYGYPNTPIKLKDTGEFQAAIKVTVDGNVVTTDSTDEKTGMLMDRYGDIFGTYGPYKAAYVSESLRPAFNGGITAAIGLKFK